MKVFLCVLFTHLLCLPVSLPLPVLYVLGFCSSFFSFLQKVFLCRSQLLDNPVQGRAVCAAFDVKNNISNLDAGADSYSLELNTTRLLFPSKKHWMRSHTQLRLSGWVNHFHGAVSLDQNMNVWSATEQKQWCYGPFSKCNPCLWARVKRNIHDDNVRVGFPIFV